MVRIEGQRGIVTIAFVGAVATAGDTSAPGLHGRGIPKRREIPVVVAQIANRIQNLAAGNGPLVINDSPGVSRPTAELLCVGVDCSVDQLMHVNVNCRAEETGPSRIVIPNGRRARVFIDSGNQFMVARLVDFQLGGDSARRTNVIYIDLVGPELVLEKAVPLKDPVLVALHEAGASLDVEPLVLFLDLLQAASSGDGDIPTPGLLPDPVMLFLEPIDSQRYRQIQLG